eukprot:scaffold204321_cov30-Tisochrysis_lutea.AAC.2
MPPSLGHWRMERVVRAVQPLSCTVLSCANPAKLSSLSRAHAAATAREPRAEQPDRSSCTRRGRGATRKSCRCGCCVSKSCFVPIKPDSSEREVMRSSRLSASWPSGTVVRNWPQIASLLSAGRASASEAMPSLVTRLARSSRSRPSERTE